MRVTEVPSSPDQCPRLIVWLIQGKSHATMRPDGLCHFCGEDALTECRPRSSSARTMAPPSSVTPRSAAATAASRASTRHPAQRGSREGLRARLRPQARPRGTPLRQFLQSWAPGSQKQRNALGGAINAVLPGLRRFCREEGTCPGSVPGRLFPLLRQQ